MAAIVKGDSSADGISVSPVVQNLFAGVTEAPPDPILGLSQACAADKNPQRQNLGPGVYMDGEGLTRPLGSVLKAEQRLLSRERREGYLAIDGNPSFNRHLQGLVFGAGSKLVESGSVATVQSVGGTGAICLAAHLVRRLFPEAIATVSDPTWPNHHGIFAELGFAVQPYPYYDSERREVRFDALMSFLKGLPQRAVVVLHASCHNPTGCDLSDSQWHELTRLFASSGHIALIDFAYQGFKRGLDEDAEPVRRFVEAGIPCFIATSLSKSFSLYSQRVGALHVVCASHEESSKVTSQLKQIVRACYSNPPSFGASLVAEVLGDKELRATWQGELSAMRLRIIAMRKRVVDLMKSLGHDFSHVMNQHGMFSYTGLTPEQVSRLRAEFSIYMTSTGRVSIPALNDQNVEYICKSLAAVIKK